MEETGRKRKKGEFVVTSKDEEGGAKRLREADDFVVEEIREMPHSYIVRAKDTKASEESTRKKLKKVVGEESRITNVLEDDDGHVFIPTGKINVIMSRSLPKAKLREWSDSHQIDVVTHSKWRPKSVQVELKLELADADEALERLKDDPSVEMAEPDVLTDFKRETD